MAGQRRLATLIMRSDGQTESSAQVIATIEYLTIPKGNTLQFRSTSWKQVTSWHSSAISK